MRFSLVISSIALSVWTSLRLLNGQVYLTAVPWLVAIVALWIAHPHPPRRDRETRRFPHPIALLVIGLPAIVRFVNFDLDRVHGDDLLTGYFSSALDLRRDFFAPVPDDPGQWVAQFPAPFFLFQKLFFVAFGESLLTVKLSVLPYVVIVSALLYQLTREILDERAAIIAVLLYAFLGPSLYLETLGLMFVSSTAVFMAFLLYVVRERQSESPRDALLAGMFAGACYLFYLSSFIALPVALVFVALGALRSDRTRARQNGLTFVAGAATILAPFVADSVRYGSYFARRFHQVSLIGGEWSPYRDSVQSAVNALKVAALNLTTCIRSLYEAGLGGHGGYDFGHQALLAPVILGLATVGTLRALWLARRRVEWLVVLLVIVLSFLTGMVLTIPPPAFHRLSLAFPFIALVAALPLHAVVSARRGSSFLRHAIVVGGIAAVALEGTLYLWRAAVPESPYPPFRLARFINAHYPGRALIVAAFPGYAFEKIYHFVPDRRATSVETGYHKDLLPKLDPTRPYVYVVTMPEIFDPEFVERDPRGRIIRFSHEFTVFVN